MRRIGFVLLIVVAGCQRPATSVYVNLSAVPAEELRRSIQPRVAPAAPAELPAQSAELHSLQGAEHSLTQTSKRIQSARALIAENRQQALRGLRSALYRSYAHQAEADRQLRYRDLDKETQALWDGAFEKISALLKVHARSRMPLSNRLALLLGFPFKNPALQKRPENPRDAKSYDEEVTAWKKLLSEDQAFAQQAQKIIDEIDVEIGSRQVQAQIDFNKKLNDADDRSSKEAEDAVANSLPDFVGGLSQRLDVHIPPNPSVKTELSAVVAPPKSSIGQTPSPIDLKTRFFEHDLDIWLAQNGYVRAARPELGVDRTKEFIAWLKTRQPGP